MRLLFTLLIVLSGSSACTSVPSQTAQAVSLPASSGVEDIYVVRSVRQTRVSPTKFCDAVKTSFDNLNAEDEYAFRSVATRTSDGLITDASVQTVGTIRACFGPGSDPNVLNFYGEGQLSGVSFTGRGDCRQTREQPESGLSLAQCFLDLGKLPEPYKGGRLTSNTVTSRNNLIGEKTDPPGYVQSSIATVRLWKRREPAK
jgi:hypothetical protein